MRQKERKTGPGGIVVAFLLSVLFLRDFVFQKYLYFFHLLWELTRVPSLDERIIGQNTGLRDFVALRGTDIQETNEWPNFEEMVARAGESCLIFNTLPSLEHHKMTTWCTSLEMYTY